MIEVHLTAQAIPAEELGRASVTSPYPFEVNSCERVKSLDIAIKAVTYDAFPAMTLEVFRKVCDEAIQQWGEEMEIRLWHRTGQLEVGSLFLYLQVLGSERSAVHATSNYILEEIKKRAPIWKKEITSSKTSEPFVTPFLF